MEISEENLRKKENFERFPEAHPEGSGLEEQKYKKIPDSSPLAESTGKGKNVSCERREPSPGRKLPPRATIKRRSAPQTPCSDQTRGPEPSPGEQGWADPPNPMGNSAENPAARENPEQNTPVLPPVAPLARASGDPLVTPPGWAERAGNSGRGERVPGEAPGELPAGPRDPGARACARADPAGKACDKSRL